MRLPVSAEPADIKNCNIILSDPEALTPIDAPFLPPREAGRVQSEWNNRQKRAGEPGSPESSTEPFFLSPQDFIYHCGYGPGGADQRIPRLNRGGDKVSEHGHGHGIGRGMRNTC